LLRWALLRCLLWALLWRALLRALLCCRLCGAGLLVVLQALGNHCSGGLFNDSGKR
jgi:hypothetical protein